MKMYEKLNIIKTMAYKCVSYISYTFHKQIIQCMNNMNLYISINHIIIMIEKKVVHMDDEEEYRRPKFRGLKGLEGSKIFWHPCSVCGDVNAGHGVVWTSRENI